ncbi:regulatory protein RecX [Magnetospirillum molischianum]|uniref:Regulatory protein RecX n=1 Tax=Magnetospirillum molischianum DSM 120 TaxID=1150626 RepID=H8FW21_MAGML|nr:regulatory protein RecX [Magnetospirillum molischianum]CCG42559.1 Regulatory protein recX [Magnetospirillum molischianum DSM 120]
MTGRAGRVPPQITASYIENAAMHYLERFASSRANLRRVLMTKVRRSLAHWGGEPAEAEAVVDAVLLRLTGLGYLDDAVYADIKVRGLARRGGSLRAIRATLSAKGVEAETVAAALTELGPDSDRAAALALARRRRLGPFRLSEVRADYRTRDLASLGRAGFSWEVARAVIDGDGAEPDDGSETG